MATLLLSPTERALPDDRRSFERPCNVIGCERMASQPHHLYRGRSICPQHAAIAADGVCEWCGETFAYSYAFAGIEALRTRAPMKVFHRVYANKDGKAYCLECWTSEGYGYPMPERRT